MSADPSPVRRCIAVASHGRRCQQSPFRGSPYCWHHLQSRKVPAPSRIRAASPVVTASPAVEALPAMDPMTAAARLVRGLNHEALSALVEFAEATRDGSLTLRKDHGAISVEAPAPRSARTAVH